MDEQPTPATKVGETKIAGGEEASLYEFPYHVALRAYDEAHWHNCALYPDRWVITTAWAAKKSVSENAFVILGAHIRNNTEVTQQKSKIDKQAIHESYKRTLTQSGAGFVSTIAVAAFNAPDFNGARLRLTGFGNTESGARK